MEPHFEILGSNSSGNCALLVTESSKVLIDAGFSARKILAMLAERGLGIEAIDGVFLTHEHHDHASGLRGLAKFPHLRFFANRDTARAIQERLRRRPNWQVFETGSDFEFRDLRVTSFSVPHDAYDPVGFVFEWGYGDLFSQRQRLAWITDLGYVPQLVRERIRAADILVVEANYDDDMLDGDPHRPWSVKQRIKGRHGHLSNQNVLELLQEMEEGLGESVYLIHLSRDCNCVRKVQSLFSPLARRRSATTFQIIDPNAPLNPAIRV